jgi:hypothetical protein
MRQTKKMSSFYFDDQKVGKAFFGKGYSSISHFSGVASTKIIL